MSALGKRTREDETPTPVSVPPSNMESKDASTLDMDAYRAILGAPGANPCLGAVATFAGCVENHAGMQKVGEEREALTKEDLEKIGRFFKEKGCRVNALRLHKMVGEKLKNPDGTSLKAYVIHVRNAVEAFDVDADELKAEYESVTPDTTFLNTRRGVVQNKNARYNFNIGDNEHRQCPNIQEGKGTVVSFEDLPLLAKVRAGLTQIGEEKDITKIMNLLAEANIYHSQDSGIGYHGDSERKIVIGANMGKKRIIEFCAFREALPVGNTVVLKLRPGDMYFMCVNACGHDWSKGCYKLDHFRHRAGYPQWLQRNDTQLKRKWEKMRAKRATGNKRRKLK